MTAIFTNIDAMKKHFNLTEIDFIRDQASAMLVSDKIEWYFPVNGHDVCLERETSHSKVIRIARMQVPMWRNNANVHGMNSRPKKASV